MLELNMKRETMAAMKQTFGKEDMELEEDEDFEDDDDDPDDKDDDKDSD